MDFFGVNGTCYGAHPDILKFVPFGVQFAERYKAFGEFFQKVVCAFIFGFSLYKQKIVYLSNIYIELFLMVRRNNKGDYDAKQVTVFQLLECLCIIEMRLH